MRIPTFEVQNQRSIRLAACDSVPRFMMITGPNGCGKSTLLFALRNQGGRDSIMYVGPHRNPRKQIVEQKHLFVEPINMRSLLELDDSPGIEGIQRIGGQRDAWSYDETGNYLKHSLCQVEHDWREAIADRYARDGEIARGALPDPWRPLRDLTEFLLPHLSFESIDTSIKSRTRCLWKVHGGDQLVDLDDLSSGERAIVQMFYPLLERQIRDLVTEASGREDLGDDDENDSVQGQESCLLIDEPDLHLHPNLQAKVFDYMRMLALGDNNTQIIVATHSPTIVEQATAEELYLLRPAELVEEGQNQLVAVASDDEHLRFLQGVFGTTANITAMQPMVVVEGTSQTGDSKSITDEKLYRALYPKFNRVSLIPGGGKSECIKLLDPLKIALERISPSLRAVALLDRDVAGDSTTENVYILPVSMIENFLVDPDAIWEAIQSIVEQTTFTSAEQVAGQLDVLLDEAESREIERRILAALGSFRFQPHRPTDQIATQIKAFVGVLEQRYSVDAIEKARESSNILVEQIKSSGRRREQFHGKEICDQFYGNFLRSTSLAKNIFLYETARHARQRAAVQSFFGEFFDALTPSL